MSVRYKVLTAHLGFVAIILVLGGLAHQLAQHVGGLVVDVYDHPFVGMSYADRVEADFLRVAAAARDGLAPPPATVRRMRDQLDVALERASARRTVAAGREVRDLLAALPDVPAAGLPAWTAQADRAITELVKQFSAEGLAVRDEADDLSAYGGRLMLTEMGAAVCLALGVGMVMGRGLSRPLIQLARTIGLLAAGDLALEVSPSLVRRADEIGAVARAVTVFRAAMRRNACADEEREQQRLKAEEEKRQAALLELRRLRLLSDLSRDIVIIQRDGLVLQINAAGSALFGLPDDHAGNVRLLDLISEADHPLLMQCLRGDADPGHREINLRAATGALVPAEFSCSTIDYEGRPAGVIALRDLSDQKRNEAHIRHLAFHDPLTSLPNRLLLHERLASALGASARLGQPVALLYVDLDRFKPVNDLLGHAAGDAVLIDAAKRLRGLFRSTDTVARIGGDEFVVVTMVDRPGRAAVLAEGLIGALAAPFDIGTDTVEIGASIGIAVFPTDGDSQDSLMRAADIALYRAKNEKRGSFRFFEPHMDEALIARKQLERDLQHAIAREQLQLHYQPVVACITGEVEGFEALLRWHHPELGLVPPVEFIAVAEASGQIVAIGQWALQAACEAAARWTKPCRLAVNVSPIQFQQSDLSEIVAATLVRSGLPASRLEIEITEGVVMTDPKRGVEVLSRLHEMGVSIALDDFGTGYSSLSYLQTFRFDRLKIDRSFIIRLGEAEDSTIIVRAIIGLAHNLGLEVVAEGVETAEQLAVLRDLSCDQVQGYLLGRPARMADVTELITARARLVSAGHGAVGVTAARPGVAPTGSA